MLDATAITMRDVSCRFTALIMLLILTANMHKNTKKGIVNFFLSSVSMWPKVVIF